MGRNKLLDIKWNLTAYFNQYEKFKDSEKLKIRTALDSPKIYILTGSKPWMYMNSILIKEFIYIYENAVSRNRRTK